MGNSFLGSKLLRMKAVNMIIPLFVIAEAHATAQDVHNIIDICTSSERIVKDYALIGMKVTYHNPQKDLEETVKHLDSEMAVLEKEPLPKALHEEEVGLHKEWEKIEENLTHTPEKKSALTLHHYVEAFAAHCEVVAEHLAKDTGNPAEHFVVLIARLNLKVQELAGTYVIKAWGAIGDEEYYREVAQILKDYNKTYEELMGADEKLVSAGVKKRLKVLKKHFKVFEFMAESKSGRFVPLLAAKKANKIHKETNEILKEEESEEEK